jgi:hypothetical protein
LRSLGIQSNFCDSVPGHSALRVCKRLESGK